MQTLIAVLFVLHGFAHGVGFAVPWKLVEAENVAYKATLLAGQLDVGNVGIRVLGILWLLTGLAFIVTGVGAWMQQTWWSSAAVVVSLVMSVLAWPDARIGVALNVAILLLMTLGPRLGWLDI